MNESADDIIQAQQAPLSHLADAAGRKRLTDHLDWRNGAVAVVVVAVLITALLWQPGTTTPTRPADAVTPQALDSKAPAAGERTQQLAPFAQTQHERARELAQDALAQFVEKQILLEDTMQVASWAGAELEAAMALAQTGDSEFLAERFDASLHAYAEATKSLDDIIARGASLFDQHLASGLQQIAELQPDEAIAAIEQALVIKPNDPDAQAMLRRAQQIPEIIGLLRTAKNHELGGRFADALAVYAEIRRLDPQTTDLRKLETAAANAQAGHDLTSHLSRGFAALAGKEFERAKQAFNAALALDANNDIAKGGLQQVAKENDLAIIRGYRAKAEAAMASEEWQAAIDAYQRVLNLDGNIQFALNGQKTAQTHLRSHRLLERIATEPQKLSAEKLYLDAVAILQDAGKLEYAGPQLTALVAEVDRLLRIYRDPVDVVLLSDNATNVIMSNVGQLGFFERKTLTLRPGQYTIRGSQDGCRDIFLSVEVLPGIAPLDLSCPETIKP